VAGGKSRKTGGISKALINRIKSGIKGGKAGKDRQSKESKRQQFDPFGLKEEYLATTPKNVLEENQETRKRQRQTSAKAKKIQRDKRPPK
jgi:hypothetical protein